MTEPPGEPLSLPPAAPPRRGVTGGSLGALASWSTVLGFFAVLVVVLLGRTLRAPPVTLLVAVTFLPYELVVFGLYTAVVWARVPDRRGPALSLTAQVLLALVLWGPTHGRDSDAVGAPLRVMSWNVQRLWGVDGLHHNATGCVAEAVRAAQPDVVTLLEISGQELEPLEAQLGLRCVHTPYRGGESDRQGGLAACVRGDRWQLRSGSALRFVDDEDWFYVFTEVEREGVVINVLSVHLYPYEVGTRRMRERVRRFTTGDAEAITGLAGAGADVMQAQSDQSRALLERVERLEDPTVVAGDFNSVRDLSLHVALRERLADVWERAGEGSGATVWFLDALPLRVDYIYASARLQPSAAVVPAVDCSDHRPVVSDLRVVPLPISAIE